MVLVRDTSACLDDYLGLIIFKSYYAGQNYEADTILEYTKENTHKHTHGQDKLYMPFRHFMAGRGITTRSETATILGIQ